MKRLLGILIVGFMFFAGGCGTEWVKIKYDFRGIRIVTEPEGAVVSQYYPIESGGGGTVLGATPIDMSVAVISDVNYPQRSSCSSDERVMLLLSYVNNVQVRIEKDGYKPYVGMLRTSADTIVTHTIKLEPVE